MLKLPQMWWIVAQQGESSWGRCDVFHYTSAAVLWLSLPPSAHHVLHIALHLRFPSLCQASSHVLLPWPAPLGPLFSHPPPLTANSAASLRVLTVLARVSGGNRWHCSLQGDLALSRWLKFTSSLFETLPPSSRLLQTLRVLHEQKR